MSTHNPVSFVKGHTAVYTVGYNVGGYSPDPDSVSVVATLETARAILADMIDRFVDHESESFDESDVSEDNRASGWLWDGHGFADASMEAVKPGSNTWEEVGNDSGCSVYVEDSAGYGHTYWIDRSTIAEAFGSDWHADLTADYCPRELAGLITELEGR
jgi:hypothetical protein